MSIPVTDEQLLELQRMATLGRLLASVAHEFSTPIASILSNVEMETRLLERLDAALVQGSTEKARQLVASCRDLVQVDQLACERIRRMVRSLKTASRAGGCAFQRVNLNEILDASLLLAKTLLRGRVEVHSDFGELPEVDCHPDLLSQVFLNLLANAGQAIEGTGVIRFGSRLDGEQVHVWVEDSGRGIREEDKAKILNKGFTTKPVGVGTDWASQSSNRL